MRCAPPQMPSRVRFFQRFGREIESERASERASEQRDTGARGRRRCSTYPRPALLVNSRVGCALCPAPNAVPGALFPAIWKRDRERASERASERAERHGGAGALLDVPTPCAACQFESRPHAVPRPQMPSRVRFFQRCGRETERAQVSEQRDMWGGWEGGSAARRTGTHALRCL